MGHLLCMISITPHLIYSEWTQIIPKILENDHCKTLVLIAYTGMASAFFFPTMPSKGREMFEYAEYEIFNSFFTKLCY